MAKPLPVVAGLILNHQRQVLMLEKPGGLIFPGGKIQGREKLIPALWRELAEEIGLRRWRLTPTCLLSLAGQGLPGDELITCGFYLLGRPPYRFVPQLTGEHQGGRYCWVGRKEFTVLNGQLTEVCRECLQHLIEARIIK